ncbi:MAG: B12-binding domain-containing radical SAM protein [Planctomycetota bacterium]|jgi:radical SAM superfamily enzyme YgiQ (UPF0313 family)
MKVLLVSAATPDTFWSFKHVLPFVFRRAAFPPLGLLTVASMLPKNWQLRLIDQNTTRLRDTDIEWADYVFLSAMIVQGDYAREVALRCRSKRKTVIAGGPLFTTSHACFPEIDHFVLGEAENIMPKLVTDMESGCLEAFYSSSVRPDITQTPMPRWDLIKLKRYATMPLQFSRGCPFNCEFCDIIVMNGRIPRTKSPDQMINELEGLVEAGWQGRVFIVDDNFIGNKVKVKAFLRTMISWRNRRNIKLSFTTEASLNLADDNELLDVGIESTDEESLVECEKTQNTRRDLVAAVKTIQNSGLEVMGGFIVGFDSDKEDIFERLTSFIEQSGIVTAMVGLLTALPETRLFQRLKRENRIIHDASGNNVDGVLNFIPKLDREYLVQSYRLLVKRLYAPDAYYRRILTFFQEYRPRGPSHRPTLRDCLALIRSFWVMGICKPGRRAYWKFVARVMLFHRRLLHQAMTLAIMGHHFRKVAAAI